MSAPVLAGDLARRPDGPVVAELLRRAVGLGTCDLSTAARVGQHHRPDPAWESAWRSVTECIAHEVGSARVVAAVALTLGQRDGLDPEVLGAATQALSAAPMGRFEDLLRCLRRDALVARWRSAGDLSVLDPSAEGAAAVLAGALAAAWFGDQLSDEVSDRLRSPWAAAVPDAPPAAEDTGPCAGEVRRLLDLAGGLTAQDPRVEALVTAAEHRSGGSWARDVHAATWAVHLTDRVEAAATAQLLLAARVHHLPAVALATGAWSVLSGAVQAAVVGDLVDPGTGAALLGPALEVLEDATGEG